MKILSMHILHKRVDKSIFLKSSYQLDFMNFLKRKYAKEGLVFSARTIINKIKKGQMIRIQQEDSPTVFIYGHVNDSNIGVVLICDDKYPESAACRIILEIETKFLAIYSADFFNNYSEDQDMKFPELDVMISKYQDPQEADKLIKIEKDLDEIQHTLHKTMNDLMDRGEKLDDLMKKSEDISGTAYSFYKKSKEANQSCCSLY